MVVVSLLLFPPYMLVAIDSFFRLLYLVVRAFYNVPDDSPDNFGMRLLFLVIAHDEEDVIENTINVLLREAANQSEAQIVLLSDHCSDRTSEIGILAGVRVISRIDGLPGKGQALSWFVKNYEQEIASTDIVIILDADSLVDSCFTHNIRKAFAPDIRVVQSQVCPIRSNDHTLTLLASYSELLSQHIDDLARQRLKWSVPLRGTGMAFRSDVFRTIGYNLQTQVEDIEISIRLAKMGIPVHFSPNCLVFDPKASKMLGLARQRGRWLKGQRHILFTLKNDLWNLFCSGLAEWSLIQALLLKPKTLLALIKISLLLFAVFLPLLPSGFNNLLIASLILSFTVDFLYYFYGLNLVAQRLKYLSALLRSPIYLVLWLASWVYSILPGQGWLRGRDEP